ncbi:hypothetical protein CVT26_005588 [Gymnopilus dilepis]|uniref:C2H2-type domain-containing protein n=1 Tax=Gymnopilus dilepis TaxID=231916 RepID=A0A409XZW7_9AGAR|nr:hypothetical protein CVT26_005588 [Gymnopilus dilepis]
MSTPASDQQCQIGINVEYVADAPSEHEPGPLSGLGLGFGYLTPDSMSWRSHQSAPSEAGSDCHSDASSPFPSPFLGASDLFTDPPPSSVETAALDAMPLLSLHTDFPYNYHSPNASPSPSSPYSDSPASASSHYSNEYLLSYSASPFSSSQSSLLGSVHSPSSSPIKSPHALLGLDLYPSPEASPSLYPASISPVHEGLYLTPGPHDNRYPMSPLSPSLFQPLPGPVQPPKTSPTFIPEVTEFITEVAESQSQLNAESVRHQLLETLSPGDPNTADLKTLFSKSAKSTVSTEAGRLASESRRKHPARFACHFPGCNSTFTRKLGLENHHKSHLGITDQQCRFCSKRFPNSLPRHMKRCKDNPNRITTKKTKRPEFSAESGTMR